MSALNNASIGIQQNFNEYQVNSADMAESVKNIAMQGGVSED